MKLAVITSGGANFYSVAVALERLGVNYQLTCDKNVIEGADGVILPGVGSAAYAMAELARNDLLTTLQTYTKPLLGICLGMQLLYEYSAEGDVAGLGILPGRIEHLPNVSVAVPHMGWNNLQSVKGSSLLTGIDISQDVYFVHSYFAPINEATVASCNYGVEFTAIAAHANFYGMQFHPEKSGTIGAQLLNNFIEVVNANLSSN